MYRRPLLALQRPDTPGHRLASWDRRGLLRYQMICASHDVLIGRGAAAHRQQFVRSRAKADRLGYE